MPIDFSKIKTTGNRPYKAEQIAALNDSLKAFPIKQRAAILGTFIEESGGDPMAKSENGTYQGLLQWGDDRYRISSNDPQIELTNQLKYLRSSINDTIDGKSWTHGGEGSGYNSFRETYNTFNNKDLPLEDVYRAFSYGYVRPKGKEDSYNNRLKVVQQVYDILNKEKTNIPEPKIQHVEQPDAIKPLNPYSAPIESSKTGYGPYKDKYSFTESEERKAKVKKAVEARQLYNKVVNATNLQNTAIPQFKSKFLDSGGFLQPKDAWDKLSMAEKAAMMKVAVSNGIYNLNDIRQKYNEFAEGGDTEWSYESWKNQINEHLGINIDEDNTYDYESYFKKYPEEAWKMLRGDSDAHFTDEFKTVYHPTFSAASPNNDGSIYSGVKHPIYNPQGLKGGTWSPDYSIFTMSEDGYRGPVSMDDRTWYLMNNENNGVVLRESDGTLPLFDNIPWGGVLPNVTITGKKHSIGGPLVDALPNEYAKGGDIHIKPSHRGRLTELKKRTGKTEAELYNDGNPAHKRMVVFARNARKWKHGLGGPLVESAMNEYMHGGPMGNYYDGFGDAWNLLKKGVRKARQKVRDWGLDKSPAAHLSSRLEKASKDIQENKNPEFSTGTTALLNTGRILGLNSYTKGSDNDTHYRQNLYNLVDPTNVIPESMGDYLDYANIVRHAKSDKDYKYRRVKKDSTADAAWAKRLELPYDSTLLISNPDGSVHLSEQLENEIPTDTTFIKQRIADNNKLLKTTYGPKRRDIEAALSIDSVALDNLRHTYRTGEPVEMDEFSHNSRNLRMNNETSPLNLLHRYTLQYNPSNNTMGYRDTYNFDGLEDFVPGKPFEIRGTIDLNKKKR